MRININRISLLQCFTVGSITVVRMRFIIVSQVRRKLAIIASSALLWLIMFILGSYLIENRLHITVSIGSFMEFSCPYGISVDKIISKSSVEEQLVVTSFFPSSPRAEQFIDYDSLEGKFSFKYPSAFILKKAAFTGGDILYHIDFHDKDDSSHGFVQVWNLPGDLGSFLDKSKETSQQTYKYFSQSSVLINGIKSYLWDYDVLTGGGYYKGMEVFLKKDGRMYRLSYFVPEEKWDDRQSQIFRDMVKSLKIKD